MFIDTHCHLDAPSLSGRLDDILTRARHAGVARYIVPGVRPAEWDRVALLAVREFGAFPAFGIHPIAADCADRAALIRLATLAGVAVAIGEIGLDYAVSTVQRDIQRAVFRAQLRMAVDAGLPVIIHCRLAFQDLLRIMVDENIGRVGGVMHAFSGSLETARECLRLGLFISVSGTVTYRNAIRPVEVARQIPLDRLVLETDAPDMTPEPFRGRENEPAFLIEIARKVAELKKIPLHELAQATTANAERLFRLC